MTNHIDAPAKTGRDRTLLGALGWDDFFERGVEGLNARQERIARVIGAQRGLFLTTDGRDELWRPPAGRLLHGENRDYPVTGDCVLVRDAVVSAVIPRRNILSRGEAGSRGGRTGAANREQAIAANLDTVFIVCGLDRDFNLRRLERYMTLVHGCGLNPVVALTKADLHASPESFRQAVENIAFGVPVVLTSMLDGRGRSALEEHLGTGRTAAMIGSSGAGKSTLANMLYGGDIQAVGAVGRGAGKGRHTTTARELIRMPQGGMLMDNPGIREIAFHEDGAGVENAFADIRELSRQCRFADCAHHNEPGCAVLRAVAAGDLTQERLESWRKINREMQYLSARQTKSAARVEKERRQDIARMRKHMKKRRKHAPD